MPEERKGLGTLSNEAYFEDLLTPQIVKDVRASKAQLELLPPPKKNKIIPYDKLVKCPHCPGAYANEMIKFVGFRGKLEELEHPKGGMEWKATLNIKGAKHEGEVHPKPIVPVTNNNRDNLIRLTGKNREELGRQFFLGILGYEIELLTLLFLLRNIGYENIMVLWPRGHGKTYCEDWEGGFGMKHFNKSILLLSETDSTLKVANWLFVWAFKNKYLKDQEKYSRSSTYLHFTLTNGSTFDMYKYMDKRTVGLHDVHIVADDMINLDWKNRPKDNSRAIDHWQSSLNPIIRTGLSVFGTRKFEGDPLQHMIETIEDLILIKMSPFIECEHENKNDDGTYDMCEVCKDLALLAPEIHSYKSLRGKMYEDWDAWFAEYMQNPHPQKGGMVDDEECLYIPRPFWTDVQTICIGVDSTESDMDSTDMCGIVSCAMLKNDPKSPYMISHFPDMEDVPCFVFLDADVRKMPFRTLKTMNAKGLIVEHRGIMETISFFIEQYKSQYINVRICIAIERQGGGIFIIKEAYNNRDKWEWFVYLIGEQKKDKRPQDLGMKEIGIRHTIEKVGRIFSELQYPIKSGQVKFAQNLWGSMFMQQVTTFPKTRWDDGVDAGGMAKDECAKRWVLQGTSENPYEGVLQVFKTYNKGQQQLQLQGKSKVFVFENLACKELEELKDKNRRDRKSVFG